ncbi:MAG: DUF2723 domain-containing protein, partial [Chitinophagaceae bacterium]
MTGFGLLIIIGIVVALCYNFRDRISSFLRIALFSTLFVILGYSTYFTTLIRSSANPSVDMYNVDNPVSLVGYLSRDQYGEWPILYGPDFTYRPPSVDAGDLYAKGDHEYKKVGKIRKQDFSAKPSDRDLEEITSRHPDWETSKIGPRLFPRMYDNSNERNQEYVYRTFGGLDPDEQPNAGSNFYYFLNYQVRWMYWRYFMWNFAGKQNDLQGFGNSRDGNWASGINFLDEKIFKTSTPDILPETAGHNNKANNKLFFLPFLFGIVGIVFQFKHHLKDFIVSFLLFFLTGFAIVIYLNQSGYQPRERDYAFVGSFYAYCIWIGIGVLWLADLLQKGIKGPWAQYLAFGIS